MIKQVIMYGTLIKISMRCYPLQNLQVSLKIFWILALVRGSFFLTATAAVKVPALVLVGSQGKKKI